MKVEAVDHKLLRSSSSTASFVQFDSNIGFDSEWESEKRKVQYG